MILHRGERYRLYPEPAQIERVTAWEDALRWLWNHAQAERLAKLEFGYVQPTAFGQQRDLTALRATLPWLADVPRDVCAQLLVELDKAWQRGFKKIAKMPRYKHKNRGDRAPLIAPQKFRVEGRGRAGSVVFPKLGAIRAVIHRPPGGIVKTCALVRDGHRWFACVSWERTVADPAPSTKSAVGIDRGVVNLLADSDGILVPGPRTYKALQQRIARAQHAASHKQRGSRNQLRAKQRTAVLHRTARLQREAVLHRESKRYAKNHGVLVVERLNTQSMTTSARGTINEPGTNVAQKAGFNRAILDSGWGRWLTMLWYKAEAEGARVIEVPAAYSSRECAVCHHIARENRPTQSKFECVACGHRDHADTNAAKVILRRGTHGVDGCGGDEITRPAKQQLRVARRAPLRVDPGTLSVAKAPAFMPG